MSPATKQYYDFEEYLDIEARSPVKHQYHRGELYVMAGAKPDHNHVSGNTYHEGRTALKGRPCIVFNSDQRVYVKNSDFGTYPDVTFVCGKAEYVGKRKDTLANPVVIVEVLSDSTREYDAGAKFDLYKQLASLKEYVLIDPDTAEAVVHTRQDDGSWKATEFSGLETNLPLLSIGIQLPMRDLFENVELRGTGLKVF